MGWERGVVAGTPFGVGMTAELFAETLHRVKSAAEAAFAACGDPPPIYSFDNARFHTAAIPDLNISADEEMPLPPHSPDLHKVVEHQHALIKREFQKRFTIDRSISTRDEAKTLLSQVIQQVVKADSVAKDANSLYLTYKQVQLAVGDYPSSRFR